MNTVTAAAILATLTTAIPCAAMNTSDDPRPLYDLPLLPDTLVIDGDGAEWGTHGLRIGAFAEDASPPADPSVISAEMRLGWTAQGLAVLAAVRSSLPWNEAEDVRSAYTGDSIELFVRAGSTGSPHVQPVIAPGMERAELRSFVYDYRAPREEWRDVPTAAEAARSRTPGGFVLEVLVPWSQLRFAAATGTVCEFSVKINKIVPGSGRLQLTWPGPTGDAYQRLRLAEGSSPAVMTAAWVAPGDTIDRLGACAVAPADGAGKILSMRRGDAELVRVPLTAQGGRAVACAWVATPPPGPEPVVLMLDGVQAAQAPVPDVVAELRRDLERAARGRMRRAGDMRPDRLGIAVPALLTRAELPAAQVSNPGLARLAGVGSVSVKWFGPNRKPVEKAERPGRYGAVITAEIAGAKPAHFYQTCVRLPDGAQPSVLAAELLKRVAPNVSHDPQCAQGTENLSTRLAGALGDSRAAAVLIAALMDAAADGAPPRPTTRERDWWHAVRTQLGTETVYHYFKLLPDEYDADKAKRWPAVIYLHGSGGELPSDYDPIEKRTADRDLIGWAKGKHLPIAIYALQSFGGWEPPAVLDAIEKILSEDRIDPDRITIMGFSMGGMGTWECAVDHPERFAAAVPIGGRGGRARDCAVLVGRVPVWVFNGDADTTTTLADAERGVNALKAAGGDVRLTVLPGATHGDSQNGTFSTPGLWDWVLERRRVTPAN
ncbi:prolyl oligopeptidase family serine peptidase [bacterium]|nr:prolyl oligopeptidase family serine peptidase [bacterium]